MHSFLGGAAAIGLLALSACDGDPAPVDNEAVNRADGADSIQNQLAALPEGQRNGVFIRAIRDSGADCQQVESSESAGEYQGLPLWRAYCSDGASFTIVIANGGTAQVLDDSQVRLANETAPVTEGER